MLGGRGQAGRGVGGRGGAAAPVLPAGANRVISTISGRGHDEVQGQSPSIAAIASKAQSIKVENLSDAKPISAPDLATLLSTFKKFEDLPTENEDIVRTLQAEKLRFLFSSQQLLQIVGATPSLKTKIILIECVIGRVTDPKARVADFVALFKNSDQKQQIEELFKQRAQTLDSAKLLTGQRLLSGGRVGGGGRGGTAGGAGRGLSHSYSTNSLLPPATLSLATLPPPILQPPTGRNSSNSVSSFDSSKKDNDSERHDRDRDRDSSSSQRASTSSRDRDSMGSVGSPANPAALSARTSLSRDPASPSARWSVDDASLQLHSSDYPNTEYRPSHRNSLQGERTMIGLMSSEEAEGVVPPQTKNAAPLPAQAIPAPVPPPAPAPAHTPSADEPPKPVKATDSIPLRLAADPISPAQLSSSLTSHWSPEGNGLENADGNGEHTDGGSSRSSLTTTLRPTFDPRTVTDNPPALEAWETSMIESSAEKEREVRLVRKKLGLAEDDTDTECENNGNVRDSLNDPSQSNTTRGSSIYMNTVYVDTSEAATSSASSEYWERKALTHENLAEEAGDKSKREVEKARSTLGLGLALAAEAISPGGGGSASSSGSSAAPSRSGDLPNQEHWEERAGVTLPVPVVKTSVRASVMLREAAIAASNRRSSVSSYFASAVAAITGNSVTAAAPEDTFVSNAPTRASFRASLSARMLPVSTPTNASSGKQPTTPSTNNTTYSTPYSYTGALTPMSLTPPTRGAEKEDPRAYLDLPWEGPIGKDDQGRPLFSYKELVRRNLRNKATTAGSAPLKPAPGTPMRNKEDVPLGADTHLMHSEGWYAGLEGLPQGSLEDHLEDSEFSARFAISRADYRRLPKWKQNDLKKSLSLF